MEELKYSRNYPLFSEVEHDRFRTDPGLLRAKIEALRWTIKKTSERALGEAESEIRWRAKQEVAAAQIAKIEATTTSAGASSVLPGGESKFGKRRRLE